MSVTKDELKTLFDEFRNVVTIDEHKKVTKQAVYNQINESGFNYDNWKEENKLTRKRSPKINANESINFEWSESTKMWIEEAKKYNFIVYTLSLGKILYIGYTGDLLARIYQHKNQFWNKQNRNFEIISCEFYQDKEGAIFREWELICYYKLNNYSLENRKITKPERALDFLSERYKNSNCTPSIPSPANYVTEDFVWIPTYKNFINWLEDNPQIPFAEKFVHNCEGSAKKHWASIIQTTFALLRKYMEENQISKISNINV